LCPLIAALGFFLGQSNIEPFPNQKNGVCSYTALVANPSTGKSQALNLIKRAIGKVENYYDIPHQDSRFTNAASVEGLLDNLSKINVLIGKFRLQYFTSSKYSTSAPTL
jgi:hypothetical protein